MKNIAIVVFGSLALILASCKAKSSTKTASNTSVTQPMVTNGEQTIKYRLVVSFTSHASGIDAGKYDLILNYIKGHAKKPAYDELPMGREGERDVCMLLKEMNSSEQKTFIEEIKKLAQGSDRVVVNENLERTKRAQ